jgi:hypothetical protein
MMPTNALRTIAISFSLHNFGDVATGVNAMQRADYDAEALPD